MTVQMDDYLLLGGYFFLVLQISPMPIGAKYCHYDIIV